MPSTSKRLVRIVHISPGGMNGRGGMGRFVFYLKEALNQSEPTLRVEVLDSYGPERFYLMPLWFIATVLGILGRALRPNVSVILHIHMSSYGSVARKLTLLVLGDALGCRTVLHLHGSQFAEFVSRLPGWGRDLLVATMGRADRVVVIGSFWQRYVVDTLGLDPKRVRLVHNGVPPPPNTEVPKSPTFRILALGELGRRKGTAELIQALRLLRDHHLEWQAVLAGNGEVEKYREQVCSMGLRDRVQLPGWIERQEAQRELAACDVLALPSFHEGLPIAILEAMSMGRAVVATPVGAITDAVVHRVTGILVPAGDVGALHAALLELLENEDLRKELGARANAHFRAHFDIGRTAELIRDMYTELLRLE